MVSEVKWAHCEISKDGCLIDERNINPLKKTQNMTFNRTARQSLKCFQGISVDED